MEIDGILEQQVSIYVCILIMSLGASGSLSFPPSHKLAHVMRRGGVAA